MSVRRAILRRAAWVLPLLVGTAVSAAAQYRPVTAETVVDLTGTVSMFHQQWWPGGQRHHQPVIVPYSAKTAPVPSAPPPIAAGAAGCIAGETRTKNYRDWFCCGAA